MDGPATKARGDSMQGPRIIPSLPEKTYREIAAINFSQIRDYYSCNTPHHFFHTCLALNRPERAQTPAMSFGTAFHRRILEPDLYSKTFEVIPDDTRANTITGKKLLAEVSVSGKTPLKASIAKAIEIMAQTIASHPGARYLLSKGTPELSIFWAHEENQLKGRLDWVNHEAKVIVDLKTTLIADAEDPRGFPKVVREGYYDLQAAFYTWGLKEIAKEDYTFVFIAIEKEYPYAVSLATLQPSDLEKAHQENLEAIEKISSARQSHIYPGYGDNIHTLILPTWR